MANPLFNGKQGAGTPTPQAPTMNVNQQIANMLGGLKQMGVDPRQIQSMLKGGMNPQTVFGIMSKKYPKMTPQFQQIQQLMQSGGSPKEMAMGLMKAKGIDPSGINPQEIMSLLNGNNG